MGFRRGTVFLIMTLGTLTTGCFSTFSASEISTLVVQSLSCEDFESRMFDQLLLSLNQDQELPLPEDIARHLRQDFENLKIDPSGRAEIYHIINKFESLYSEIYHHRPHEINSTYIDSLKKYLMAIETRDFTETSFHAKSLISEYEQQLKELQTIAKILKQDCYRIFGEGPSFSIEGDFFQSLRSQFNREVYGAFKTFSTAYQNCEALKKPALGNSSSSMEGVREVGTHFNGQGSIRQIASLTEVQRTHPYLSEIQPHRSCFNTFENPLIYDYGGKPHVLNEDTLSFFTNGGTGSSVLGLDCSAFVFSALASAGLKFHPDVVLKSRQVLSYNAARFVDPEQGGTKCFEKVPIKPGETLKPGDIVASSGHILMVTQTDEDPLGLASIQKFEDCDQISEDDFNFEIMQSSPSLGAIGINKMQGKFYFSQHASSSLSSAMVGFAQNLCQARFTGSSQNQSLSRFSVVRHKKTPECLSHTEIILDRQECVQSCPL